MVLSGDLDTYWSRLGDYFLSDVRKATGRLVEIKSCHLLNRYEPEFTVHSDLFGRKRRAQFFSHELPAEFSLSLVGQIVLEDHLRACTPLFVRDILDVFQ